MQDKHEKPNQEIKHLVRIANTDLEGQKHISLALTKIKGIGHVLSNILCNISNIEKSKKAGLLSDDEVSKLDSVIKNISKNGVPSWALNRRKDYETNEDIHLIGPDLKFTQENDIKRLKKIKSYKGMRHANRLPTRGQKTKSNFRKNRGKGSLGVKRKKAKPGRV